MRAVVVLKVVFGWLMMTSIAAAVDWQPIPLSANHVQIKLSQATVQIQTTSFDPFLVGELSEPITQDDRVLQFDYFSASGIDEFSVILGPPIVEANRIGLPSLLIAEGWQTVSFDLVERSGKPMKLSSNRLRFDFGTQPDKAIQLRNVQLRPRTDQEIDSARTADAARIRKQRLANDLKRYFVDSPKTLIESVSIDANQVLLEINTDQLFGEEKKSFQFITGNLELHEHRPHQEINEPGTKVDFRMALDGNRTVLQVPRIDTADGHDRVTSAWRIKRDAISQRHFPTSIQPTSTNHAQHRHTPRNQKGLSCLSRRGPRSDFVDLDIGSTTVNISLASFLSDQAGPNRVQIPVTGPPIYFNANAFDRYDDDMKFAQANDIVVSAILLISSPKSSQVRSPLVHPDADGGTYAMPDMTTRRGVAVYSFVLNEIAKRYNNHQRSPGGITNWIAHNEIDFHTVWTNMGQQPADLVTETYYRSMRLINNIAKQHNPHARVFVSLTHHWDEIDLASWKQLSPRRVIETLQRYSMAEGDFDWGVAYHPYAQSLFARAAWEDKRPRDDFDSPLITMENIDVLGRFLKQPSMRQGNGEIRSVILSEQGYHSHSYVQADQDMQAASLWWAMQRVRQMPWIESFIYHRWIDHPLEGGLMLGLRTLPTKQAPQGERKRSWHVYQAFGTADEATATKGLPRPATGANAVNPTP